MTCYLWGFRRCPKPWITKSAVQGTLIPLEVRGVCVFGKTGSDLLKLPRGFRRPSEASVGLRWPSTSKHSCTQPRSTEKKSTDKKQQLYVQKLSHILFIARNLGPLGETFIGEMLHNSVRKPRQSRTISSKNLHYLLFQVQCRGKKIPSEKLLNSTFCILMN